jgi:NAD(P) transhydrogenase
VAAFHSFVGLAAMITSIASYQAHPHPGMNMHNISCILGDFIGGVTLSGSLVAFGKLNGNMSTAAMSLPGKNFINLGSAATQVGLGAWFISSGSVAPLWATVALSNAMGYHLVNSVGGADMPVCITVLNSYSGWALVAEGFLLDSPFLTTVGSLIGFSGAILTKIMCDAMNRDIMNVIFGGINVAPKKEGSDEVKEHTETNVDGAAAALADSKSVMIVPGYGMAVARCQNSVAMIAKTLRDKGVEVRFGIHPVAGRMPGQMNVLLAEAGVPYDWVQEMEEVNPGMENVDTCLIVGANDTTNSGAVEGGGDHPLAGMPVIEVWNAKKVIFMKRTMGAGYADVENPVFYKENTDMLLGNATDTTEQIAAKVKELLG